jgi:hypothetical protein
VRSNIVRHQGIYTGRSKCAFKASSNTSMLKIAVSKSSYSQYVRRISEILFTYFRRSFLNALFEKKEEEELDATRQSCSASDYDINIPEFPFLKKSPK